MSKILTFKDGQTFAATGTSTIYNLQTVLSGFADVDAEADKFTVNNMTACDFDGTAYTDIVPQTITAVKDGENVILSVICRDMNQSEIIARQGEQITELQDALAEIIG